MTERLSTSGFVTQGGDKNAWGMGEAGLPPFCTGFVNGYAFAVIFPIAMVVAPYGLHLAHRLNTRQLDVGFAVFLLFVSVRFFWSLV